MKLGEIIHWVVGVRGKDIGCILVRSEGASMIMACGFITSTGRLTTEKPLSVCVKCAAANPNRQPGANPA